MENDLFDLNPTSDFVVLSFNYEMMSSKQVGRKLSYKTTMTTQQLYSGKYEERITDEKFKEIKEEAEKIKKYNIYYVDIAGTIPQMKETILQFSKEPFAKGKWLIIILDHTLLARASAGNSERGTLAELQYMFMELKKYGKNTIIQLSQLNRNIESSERITNHSLHFPTRSDLFGGDSLYQASDYVVVLHRPEILGIEWYGVQKPDQAPWPTEGLIYMHILKHREGEPQIFRFQSNLKYNRIDDYDYSKSGEHLNNP